MKSRNKLIAIGIASLSLVACNDLDTEILGSSVTSEQKAGLVAGDPDKLLYAVTGVMGNFNQYEAIYSAHIDFGYPALMLGLDSRGMDLASPNIGYNWFSFFSEMSDGDNNNYSCNLAWRYPYNNILAINTLLTSTGEQSDEPKTRFFIAQARAVRAFDYWVLAQLFQFTYDGHQNDPCVPILTSENMEAVAAAGGAPRATVEAVYTQMLDDINTAVLYLTENEALPSSERVKASDLVASKTKRLINLGSALGLRARIYLTMKNYAQAAQDAQNAIDWCESADIVPASMGEASAPTFWNIDQSCWMWGLAVNETDRTVTSGIVNWPSHMGSLNSNSYADAGSWRMINSTLFDQIPESDVRKGWWLNSNKVSSNLTSEWQKFCDDNKMPAYTQVKFAPYQNVLGNTTKGNDIPMMRIEEMYLILAEATGMSQGVAAGKEILTDFVTTYRDADYVCSASTPEAFVDAVWLQRRIELWGEGLSYFDIMRLRKAIDRRGSANWPEDWTYYVPAESNIMRLCIPLGEEETNLLLGSNNPSSPKPNPVVED